MHVRQAELIEFADHPLGGFGVRRRANDPAPELRMAGVAITPRDGRQILDVFVKVLAVDRAVGPAGCREGPFQKRVFEFVNRRTL